MIRGAVGLVVSLPVGEPVHDATDFLVLSMSKYADAQNNYC